MNPNYLTLKIGCEQFIVDSHMGICYVPFEESLEDLQWHCSELNHSHYRRLYKEFNGFRLENGLDIEKTQAEFESLMERLFEMYQILRKL